MVIESFDDEHSRMTVAQVSARTGIPRTAARRQLLSLCHFGYAQTDGKLFWLTPRILRLGQSYLESARLPRIVQPWIQRLSVQTGETVNVSVLDDHEVVYVSRSNSPRVVSIGFHAGARTPAHTVTPGYILLSRLPQAQARAWVERHKFTVFTDLTTSDPTQFLDTLRAVRQADHWITEGQLNPGLLGVAVPLVDRHNQCKAALGMTLQTSHWPREAIEGRLVPALLETAQILQPLL
jgi:IclR family pca regulon transcriptional regulator